MRSFVLAIFGNHSMKKVESSPPKSGVKKTNPKNDDDSITEEDIDFPVFGHGYDDGYDTVGSELSGMFKIVGCCSKAIWGCLDKIFPSHKQEAKFEHHSSRECVRSD